MAKVFAFPMSPANYTLDIIDNIYRPMGVKYAFVHGNSEASDKSGGAALVLGRIKNPFRRMEVIYRVLRENDVFIVNSYTEKISLHILLLNILFFKKPMGISSDTQLSTPNGTVRAWLKSTFLKWLFTRPYIYGLPGGTRTHVQLFTYYGMNENRVFILPMMVNNNKYRRSVVPLPGGKFKFIYVGRLVSCKQVDKVIEAFKSLRKKDLSAELHIVGDGIERSRLHDISKDGNIIFHGKLYGDGLIEELHKADCLILYSSREPWGLVVNEALASGIPCIVSDAVGARFDLVEGVKPTGLVVSAQDINALYDTMEKIVSDSLLWESMSNNALQRMEGWSYMEYKNHLKRFVAAAERCA